MPPGSRSNRGADGVYQVPAGAGPRRARGRAWATPDRLAPHRPPPGPRSLSGHRCEMARLSRRPRTAVDPVRPCVVLPLGRHFLDEIEAERTLPFLHELAEMLIGARLLRALA